MAKVEVEKVIGDNVYKELVEKTDCGLLILKLTRTELDDYMEIEYCNNAFLDMIGFTREEFATLDDKRCMQFITMEDIFSFSDIIATINSDSPINSAFGKVTIQGKEDKLTPTVFTAKKQEDGKIICANIRCE